MMASWTQTEPFNHSDPLAHVDWVGHAGYPLRATIHRDGKWSASDAHLARLLDTFFEPKPQIWCVTGADVLAELARQMGGQITYCDPDLALPPETPQEPGEVVLDG